MNDVHRQRNETTLCLLTNPTSACNITMIGASATCLRCWSPWSSHTFSTCHQSYPNRIMRDHTWHAMFKSFGLPIANLKRVVLASTTIGPRYTTRCYTRSTLTIYGSHIDYCTLRIHAKLL
ncbi:hypothetical protein TNCV_2683831 [Trichonephila clavipes]|nr:hypothetical protein TNCV_2683831 [Trichonephila clavipes]